MLMLLLILMLCCAGAALAEDGQDENPIVGNIVEGSYILRIPVQVDEAGEWVADDMSQDDSVVKLNYAKLENGAFEVRYDAAGDGEVTVAVWHRNGIACDQVHTFELVVKDGKIQDTTGGSYTAAPGDAELAELFAGEWREQETQANDMTIAANEEGSLTAEIVSPAAHGAYLFRMTLHYDCELDAFVYNDGVAYELPITDGEEAELGDPIHENLDGRFQVAADEENKTVLLSWYSSLRHEEADIVCAKPSQEK